MDSVQHKATSIPTLHEAEVEYLFDMIAELVKLARRVGEPETGIFLEAILAAREVAAQKQRA